MDEDIMRKSDVIVIYGISVQTEAVWSRPVRGVTLIGLLQTTPVKIFSSLLK